MPKGIPKSGINKGSFKKGKTYEEIYGIEKATEYKRKLSDVGKTKTRENSHTWKGGKRINIQGYVCIRVGKKYILEHRLVMEKFLGRTLERWELIHHKNGIKTDNKIENLEIVFDKKHYGKVKCPYCSSEFLIR